MATTTLTPRSLSVADMEIVTAVYQRCRQGADLSDRDLEVGSLGLPALASFVAQLGPEYRGAARDMAAAARDMERYAKARRHMRQSEDRRLRALASSANHGHRSGL